MKKKDRRVDPGSIQEGHRPAAAVNREEGRKCANVISRSLQRKLNIDRSGYFTTTVVTTDDVFFFNIRRYIKKMPASVSFFLFLAVTKLSLEITWAVYVPV